MILNFPWSSALFLRYLRGYWLGLSCIMFKVNHCLGLLNLLCGDNLYLMLCGDNLYNDALGIRSVDVKSEESESSAG